jgi:hypothetical protein
MQHEVLREYFKAISKSYSAQWDNKAFFLCKYVGVSAVLNVLERIVTDLRNKETTISDKTGLRIGEKNFAPYITKLKKFSFSTAEAKANGYSYVGEGGITELTKRVAEVVFGGG